MNLSAQRKKVEIVRPPSSSFQAVISAWGDHVVTRRIQMFFFCILHLVMGHDSA